MRYRIRPVSTPDPGAIYQDTFWKVYEDTKAFPRAWVVHHTLLEPSHDAAFARIDKPGIDFHRVAIVEAPLPRALEESGADDSVRFRSYGADEMSMDVNAGATGLLVLSEVYYPGWRATVNGERAEIREVDGALRGLVVPKGASRVELEYVPLSYYAGAGLGVVTVGAVLLAWFWRRRQAAAV